MIVLHKDVGGVVDNAVLATQLRGKHTRISPDFMHVYTFTSGLCIYAGGCGDCSRWRSVGNTIAREIYTYTSRL